MHAKLRKPLTRSQLKKKADGTKTIKNGTDQLQIRLKDVPAYLRDSALYKAMNDDNARSDIDEEDNSNEKLVESATQATTAAEPVVPASSTKFSASEKRRKNCHEEKSESGEMLQIPRKFMKMFPAIQNFTDARDLLHTMRYWGLDEAPVEIIDYALNYPAHTVSLQKEFPELDFLSLFDNGVKDRNDRKYALLIQSVAAGQLHIVQLLFKSLQLSMDCVVQSSALKRVLLCNGMEEFDPHELCCLAIRNDRADSLSFLLDRFPSCSRAEKSYDLSEEATVHNTVDCLQLMLGRCMPISSKALLLGAEADNEDVLLLLLSEWKSCPDLNARADISSAVLECAVSTGSTELLKILAEKKTICSESTVSKLVYHNRIDLLEFAYNQGFQFNETACAIAAYEGLQECLKFLRSKGCAWDERTAELACLKSHYKCLETALEGGCPTSTSVCSQAAARGDVATIQLARLHGCPWDSWTTWLAAAHGHKACLRFALEEGCPVHRDICIAAAKNGRLEILQFLCGRGYVVDVDTVKAAVSENQLECLQFLRETAQCPWDDQVCVAAAQAGSLTCLRYAHENGCPWSADTTFTATRHGNLECLTYAHTHGCPWDERCSEFYQQLENQSTELCRCKADCVQYAQEHGCPSFPISAAMLIFNSGR